MGAIVAVPVINSAPQSILLGVSDVGNPPIRRVPAPVPQHVPKFYLRTQKGPVGVDVYGSKADLDDIFGAKSFEINGPLWNHQTLGAITALGNANPIIVHRILGNTATKAGVITYVTVKKVTGSTKKVGAISADGKYVSPASNTVPVDAYEVSWSHDVVDRVPDSLATFDKALADAAGSRVAVKFIPAKDKGSYGNDLGSRLFGNTDETIDAKALSVDKNLPFYGGLLSRPDAKTSGALLQSAVGVKIAPMTWNPGGKDPLTGTSMYIGDVLNETYSNDGGNGLPPSESPIGKAVIFDDNVAAVLEFLYDKEKTQLTANLAGITGGHAPLGAGTGLAFPVVAQSVTAPATTSDDYDKYFILTKKDQKNKKGTYLVKDIPGRFSKAKEKTLAQYTANNGAATQVVGNVAANPDMPPATPPLGAKVGDYWALTIGTEEQVWRVNAPTTAKLIYENSSTDPDQFAYDHSNDETVGQFSEMEAMVDAYVDEEIIENSAYEGKYLINILSGKFSSGKNYTSFYVNKGATIGKSNSMWLGLGMDDDIDPNGMKKFSPDQIRDTYETAVTLDIARYTDKNDRYQNLALSVEKDLYDTGFTLDTKKRLGKFISRRKDTSIVLGTHTDGDSALTVGQEKSVAAILYSSVTSYAESDYFGTKTSRAMIATMSGKIINHAYKKRCSSVIDLIAKFSSYMGSGSGAWKPGLSPEGQPNNTMNMYDLNIEHLPMSDRTDFWGKGANFVTNYDKNSFYWPAYKTVYPVDNSVLTSKLVNSAVQTLEICLDRAQREFSGRTDLTDAQTEQYVTDFLTGQLDRYTFDSRYKITAHVEMSAVDKQRRFSWTAWYKLKAGVGRTVQTSFIETSAFDDDQEGGS